MCGIAGYVSTEAPRLQPLDAGILRCIEYRGHDAKATWSDDEHVTLHHARLSIIDLEGGGQPMHDSSGRYTIVFNGAVYNYRELRREYEKAGAAFRTSSDTEVILEGFRLKGEKVLQDLNGMFAFAIWDGHERRLFLARDRLGKKPLFWTKLGADFYFASTIHAFRQLPGWKDELSLPGMTLFNILGGFPESLSVFEQAHAIPPACYGWYRTGDDAPRIERYWRLDFSRKTNGSLGAQLEEYGALLSDAVRIRLRSDVPLALSFSGGTDSGTIAALAKTELGTDLSCYTIDYHTEAEPSEEVAIAERVARQLELPWTHIQYDYRKVMLDGFADAYGYFDQPCQQFPLVYSKKLYDVMKEHCTVVLSGNGADELFTGYVGNELTRQQDIRRSWMRRMPSNICRLIPSKRRATWETANLGGLSLADWARADMRAYVHTMAGDPTVEDACAPAIDTMVDEIRASGVDTMLDLAMQRNLAVSTADTNYRLPDITGYAAQVEVRSPFLDYRIVEFAARLPHRFKVSQAFRSPKTKFLPRVFYERFVGKETAWASKKGMGANLRWDKEFAHSRYFGDAMRDAICALEKSGFDIAPFQNAYNLFKVDYASGREASSSGGTVMNGFMLGTWLSQNGLE